MTLIYDLMLVLSCYTELKCVMLLGVRYKEHHSSQPG